MKFSSMAFIASAVAFGLGLRALKKEREEESMNPYREPSKPGTPAPACLQAIKDANEAFPGRKKASDGIMGDASHQARKSDHNDGNAFDITHDPESGCDGETIATLALQDPRTKYVIWNRRIYNLELGDKAWRPYNGANPHTHHCHVSIRGTARDDVSRWPWAKGLT